MNVRITPTLAPSQCVLYTGITEVRVTVNGVLLMRDKSGDRLVIAHADYSTFSVDTDGAVT